jgi:hypothetical protein
VGIPRTELFLLEPGGCSFESFARVIFLEEHQLLQVPKPRGEEGCQWGQKVKTHFAKGLEWRGGN